MLSAELFVASIFERLRDSGPERWETLGSGSNKLPKVERPTLQVLLDLSVHEEILAVHRIRTGILLFHLAGGRVVGVAYLNSFKTDHAATLPRIYEKIAGLVRWDGSRFFWNRRAWGSDRVAVYKARKILSEVNSETLPEFDRLARLDALLENES